jgi:hypothetical protein
MKRQVINIDVHFPFINSCMVPAAAKLRVVGVLVAARRSKDASRTFFFPPSRGSCPPSYVFISFHSQEQTPIKNKRMQWVAK